VGGRGRKESLPASGHLRLTFEPQGELSPIIGFKGIKSKMTLIKSFRAAAR
jgi:hypothetical protein